MIKILHIGLSCNPGGIESLVLNYFNAISKEDFVFDFADIYGEGLAFQDRIESCGGKIFKLPNFKKHFCKAKKELNRIILNEKYNIVHFHVLSANHTGLIKSVLKHTRAKVIVHSHNANLESGFLRNLYHKLNISKLRRLSVAKYACGIVAGKWLWGETFDEQNVVPNAIFMRKYQRNEEFREQIRAELHFSENDRIVGFVGHLCEQKNVLMLPDILKELKSISPYYKLLIIGEGPYESILLNKLEDLQLKENYVYVGKQMEVNKFYSAMDYFVLPSLFEGLPVVAIEAQTAGLPCFLSETITEEANISRKSTFLPIDNGAECWASAIAHNEVKPYDYKDFDNYDIYSAVKNLEAKYKLLCET